MNLLKTLLVPFLSATLVFSSYPTFAQNLVNTVPAFYYLEDVGDDSLSVRACSNPMPENHSDASKLLKQGFDCPIVAEISNSNLENFLANLLDEAQNHINRTEPKNNRVMSLSLLLNSTVLIVSFLLAFKNRISMPSALLSNMIATLFGMAIVTGYSGENNRNSNHYKTLQRFEQQVQAGLVGHVPKNREQFLQLFTDFVNHYGVRPDSEAVQ